LGGWAAARTPSYQGGFTLTEWAERKLKYHKSMYHSYYEGWKNVRKMDDRRLFRTMYELTEEAINAVADVDNLRVQIAMNSFIKEEYATYDKIIKTFTEIAE